MQILVINKLKQEMKKKNKKRTIMIFVVIIILIVPILIISHRVNERKKLYDARKDIDRIANQENVNDKNREGKEEVSLLFKNIYNNIDSTMLRVKQDGIGISSATTDTLFTSIKDNLHFINLIYSGSQNNSFNDKCLDSVKTVLNKEEDKKEYVKELDEVKKEIRKFQESF